MILLIGTVLCVICVMITLLAVIWDWPDEVMNISMTIALVIAAAIVIRFLVLVSS